MAEPIAVAMLVVDALEQLQVPYLIGGSLASTVHGEPRATLDSDVVAALRAEHAGPLVQLLRNEFYVDEAAVREAVRDRRSFNAIHLATMFKVDVFVLKERPFDRAQLERAALQLVATDPELRAYVASAEDTILAKLEWYRRGGEVSERQWRDVSGIVRVQGERLDWKYLELQAASLGVADLLIQLQISQ
jgi:hypothetical protein